MTEHIVRCIGDFAIRSDPTPIIIFSEQDNHVLDHIQDPLIELIKAVEQSKHNKHHHQRKMIFDLDTSRMILKSDNGCSGKIRGFKQGGHDCRYAVGMEMAKYTHIVLIQNDFFLIELNDYWIKYAKQLHDEKDIHPDDIDSMLKYISI